MSKVSILSVKSICWNLDSPGQFNHDLINRIHADTTQIRKFLTSPLFPIAIDLIHGFVRSINPLTIESQRSKGRQTEAGE
jgi:hypothetical protein